MKISKNIMFQNIDNEMIIKITGIDETIFINETGTEIINILKANNNADINQIYTALGSKYILTSESKQEISDFIECMIQKRVIVND